MWVGVGVGVGVGVRCSLWGWTKWTLMEIRAGVWSCGVREGWREQRGVSLAHVDDLAHVGEVGCRRKGRGVRCACSWGMA
jgi:hypothetical protein